MITASKASDASACIAGEWDLSQARTAFMLATRDAHLRPYWIKIVSIHGNASGDVPSATAHCTGGSFPLNVLPSEIAEAEFRREYPDSNAMPFIVHENDSPDDIRHKLSETLKEKGKS